MKFLPRVKEIEILTKKYEESTFKDDFLQAEIEEKEKQLNISLFKLYDFSQDEQDLISYVNDISIPLFRGEISPYSTVKNISSIKQYTSVFQKYFLKRYNKQGEHFKIDVYFKRYFLAIHFRIVSEKPQAVTTDESLNDNQQFFTTINRIFSTPEKITNDLFMQKDIKGFESDSFYVIKPNEAKNWHPAVAHLDLMEFVEAILKRMPNPQ
ncbi:hypothetical protein ACQ86N_34605 [Puia sp. P3]|uniref:hypothetical protein n=1 Tax=Puia sp. P3 TaxID=3423952 RepID=UPI003D66E9F7